MELGIRSKYEFRNKAKAIHVPTEPTRHQQHGNCLKKAPIGACSN